jgi:hypothetical protein
VQEFLSSIEWLIFLCKQAVEIPSKPGAVDTLLTELAARPSPLAEPGLRTWGKALAGEAARQANAILLAAASNDPLGGRMEELLHQLLALKRVVQRNHLSGACEHCQLPWPAEVTAGEWPSVVVCTCSRKGSFEC